MKGNAKGPAPLVLRTWWDANKSDPPPPWNELQNPEKQEILQALLDEQNHVCTYCGKRITRARRSSHIEHFRPRSRHPELRFEWDNLFASCGPAGERNIPETCGGAKGRWDPNNHIEPTDPSCELKFTYDGNGVISPSAIGGIQAQTMIDKLNLGDDSLDFERWLVIAELEERIREGDIDGASVGREIALWRLVASDGTIKAYGHVAARYLEDEFV